MFYTVLKPISSSKYLRGKVYSAKSPDQLMKLNRVKYSTILAIKRLLTIVTEKEFRSCILTQNTYLRKICTAK